jgi:ABC-type amino acid transport substrate-binding protein
MKLREGTTTERGEGVMRIARQWTKTLGVLVALSLAVAGLFVGFSLTPSISTRALAQQPQQDLLDEITKRGSVRLCTAAAEPWEFKDPTTGKWDGYNPALAEELGKALNVKVEWVEEGWGTTIAALQANKCDIAWIAFVRSAKRALVVDFAEPHAVFGDVVGVKRTDNRFKTYADLNKASVTFAARPDYGEVLTRKYFPNAKVRVVQGDNPDAARLELQAGRADAVVDDGPTYAAFIKKHSWMKILDQPPLETNGSAWAVRPGNEHLLHFLNTFIVAMKENGILDPLQQKWLVPK